MKRGEAGSCLGLCVHADLIKQTNTGPVGILPQLANFIPEPDALRLLGELGLALLMVQAGKPALSGTRIQSCMVKHRSSLNKT